MSYIFWTIISILQHGCADHRITIFDVEHYLCEYNKIDQVSIDKAISPNVRTNHKFAYMQHKLTPSKQDTAKYNTIISSLRETVTKYVEVIPDSDDEEQVDSDDDHEEVGESDKEDDSVSVVQEQQADFEEQGIVKCSTQIPLIAHKF